MLHLPPQRDKMILVLAGDGSLRILFFTWMLFGFFDNSRFLGGSEYFPIVFIFLLSPNCLINWSL